MFGHPVRLGKLLRLVQQLLARNAVERVLNFCGEVVGEVEMGILDLVHLALLDRGLAVHAELGHVGVWGFEWR